MYTWRKLSLGQRDELLRYRKQRDWPWHGPPHPGIKDALFHITAANFEHWCITGKSIHRMGAFGDQLMQALAASGDQCMAWCVLPNHYHLLVAVADLRQTTKCLGQMHGRTSRQWNLEDDCAQDDSAGIAVRIAQYDPRDICGQP